MAVASVVRLVAVVVALLALLESATAVIHDAPFVTNGRGSFIMGTRLSSGALSGSSRYYAAFWGVPYAKPPVGDLRFMAPQRVSMPNNTFNANNVNTPICIQVLRGTGSAENSIVGAEDCLTLQIFTPNYDEGANLDVLVFVHGGGFMYGKGPREGMQYLMEHDVVVVNVDYRLGVFGYLSFEDAEMPGNLGMWDQVAALQWVQENIHFFGGNNRSVTLVGFSAGSTSALMHTMSPQSKGLFHRVIAVSGSPLNPWSMQPSARANALRLAGLANCTATTTRAMVECLRSRTATDLLVLQRNDFQVGTPDFLGHPFSPYAPVVDHWNSRPFLPDDPRTLMKSRSAVMDVPIIMSVTANEGLFTAAEFMFKAEAMKQLDQEWEKYAPNLMHFHDRRVADADRPSIARRIREYYLPANGTLAEHRDKLVEMLSDRSFLVGVSEYARARASTQSSPVYFYHFGYRGQFSLSVSESGLPDNVGVSHADDMQYLIEFLAWSGVMTRPADQQMRRNMIRVWTSFANSSKPMVPGVTWQPLPQTVEGDTLHVLHIASPTNMSMVQQRDMGHASFWATLNINDSGSHAGRTASPLSMTTFVAIILCVILSR